MNTYNSSNSKLVNIITASTFLLLLLIAFTLILTDKSSSATSGGIFLIVVLGGFLYLYTQSIARLIIDDRNLILKKNFGSIVLPLNQIEKVVKLDFADIPMTVGSKGVFGFIGSTMDGSKSYVNNRRAMIHIISTESKFLVSCDNRDAFIREITEKIADVR